MDFWKEKQTPQDENDFRIINTPSAIAKRCFFYLQETGYLKLERQRNTARQNLQSYLFVVVLNGKGVLHYGNSNFTLRKDECFFIDCRQPHSYHSSKDEPWEIMWVHFNGCSSEEYFQLFRSQNEPVFCPASTMKFITLIQEIMRVNQGKNMESEALTSNLLVDLLTLLLTLRQMSENENENALHVKLKSVLNYVDSHFSEDISLDALSQQFYISKYYLTREFKKAYGETIFQHIIAMRINQAKRLLRFTDKSVDAISELCGFHDQSYFTKQFKKVENMTCLAFRRQWRD